MKNIGLRATARELGISHVALAKAVTKGRVSKLPDGTFDVETCRRELSITQKRKGGTTRFKGFEYRTEHIVDGDPTAALNLLGADGWELVSRQGRDFVFKRPIVPEAVARPES